jgi:hypothetical protein
VLTLDTEITSPSSSDTSSPRTLKHASKKIGQPDLPPTPPTHSRQSSNGNSIPPQLLNGDAPDVQSPSTPLNQQSPPTPDFTPPKGARRSVGSRPPPSERYSSSRTESFKTAREHPYSSDDDEVSTVRPVLPSARPSQIEAERKTPVVTKSRPIGLGLGLEIDTERTPTPGEGKKSRKNKIQEFRMFDGNWSPEEETSKVEREWDDNLMRNVTIRRRQPRKFPLFEESPPQEVLDDDPLSPTNAIKCLREYGLENEDGVDDHIQEDNLIDSPKYEALHQSVWPGTMAAPEPETPSTPDVRRFSTMSVKSNSTVIEAMVVLDMPPPQRRKTLRHTKKQIGLRDFSNDHSSLSIGLNPVSNGHSHRPRYMASKIPDRKHFSSQSTATTSSSSSRSRRELWSSGSIPVVVVPQRGSSMKPARTPSLRSTSSRRSKSVSITSAPVSQPGSAYDRTSFDFPRRGRRMSESAASSIRTMDFPPNIPARRSSLSAPTSRNTSRVGSRTSSLTAESLRAHNMIQAVESRAQDPKTALPFQAPRDAIQKDLLIMVDKNGDPFFGNRLSVQVTPFSNTSYETTGTAAEISEAMAVSLYPHQNTSVLVVEHPNPSESTPKSSLSESKPLDQPDLKTKVIPVTPPQPQTLSDEIDSPLRNPRAPPQPPAIKFIPPTPSNLTPVDEPDKQLGHQDFSQHEDEHADIPKRHLSLLRRALANRRITESVLSKHFSLKRRYEIDSATQTPTRSTNGNAQPLFPTVGEHTRDESRLHPFWRPARFWDDLEDDGWDGYGDDGEEQEWVYPRVDNRPAKPKRSLSGRLKHTFAILPITDEEDKRPRLHTSWSERRTIRRSGSGTLRVVRGRGSSESLRRAARRNWTDPECAVGRGDGAGSGQWGKNRNTTFGKLQLQWVGLRGLGRRMSERRRESRNEKLRRSISAPRDARDGVEDVLRRGGLERSVSEA